MLLADLSNIMKRDVQENRKCSSLKSFFPLYFFIAPGLIIVILFQYLPMFSNIIAFMDYDMFKGWMGLGSQFIGFANFSFLSEPWFYSLAYRTLLYSISILLTSFPLSIVLALMINELRNYQFKRVIQTISYLPHFVSWVTVAGLVYIFLSIDVEGLVNNIIVAMGGERVLFMHESEFFLPLLIITQIWKETGWGSIIYLAAIATINIELYEAAWVDGAGRWKQLIHITLPSIIPTTCILLIFSIGGLFNGNFDQFFNFQNNIIRDDTNVIATFVYYKGLREGDYSLSAAVGLFQGLVSFILIMLANRFSKKVSESGIV